MELPSPVPLSLPRLRSHRPPPPGATLCRRVAGGGARRVGRSGGEYWLHRLAPPGTGAASVSAVPPGAAFPAPPTEAAPPDVLDRAYRAALTALALSPAQLAALMRRGLPEVEVGLRSYGSLGDLEGARAAGAAAWGAAGMALARAPEFRRRSTASPAAGWVLSAHPGLIVPVGDPQAPHCRAEAAP